MQRKATIYPLLVMLLVASVAAWNVTVAADPDEDDVTVIGYEGAPACTMMDGSIWMSNSSAEWEYSVTVLVLLPIDASTTYLLLAHCLFPFVYAFYTRPTNGATPHTPHHPVVP